jgi:hypothetical protein
MDIVHFDQLATRFSQTGSRRRALRLLGAATLGAGGLIRLGPPSSEARKRRKDKAKAKIRKADNSPQNPGPQQPGQWPEPMPYAPNIAITGITVAATSVPGHDDVVVAFSNIGTLPATFRIRMIAVNSKGKTRPAVYSPTLSLTPGTASSHAFWLGCGWLNKGTVIASTDPAPVPGESRGQLGNNSLSVSFGSSVCS